jgi:hypothetical protein
MNVNEITNALLFISSRDLDYDYDNDNDNDNGNG